MMNKFLKYEGSLYLYLRYHTYYGFSAGNESLLAEAADSGCCNSV